ncbi:hypothetical protein Tco_0678950 [Tanacetum coccineum]|uniref:Uncharacterized protein n=1 Tax=Tanacetum coccineum TaxID=301880 RepID=A0ABQ4XGN2_9ASTR
MKATMAWRCRACDGFIERLLIIMVNEIPPDHVDDVPVVEPNQHDDVLVDLEPVLVDEDEDPEEDEFEEEEDPLEEEDDMEVDYDNCALSRSCQLCLLGVALVLMFALVLRLLCGYEVSPTLCGYEPVRIRYACSDSLLLTPLCCDDIHDVTPRVSALAGRDILVSEPLVIEK